MQVNCSVNVKLPERAVKVLRLKVGRPEQSYPAFAHNLVWFLARRGETVVHTWWFRS